MQGPAAKPAPVAETQVPNAMSLLAGFWRWWAVERLDSCSTASRRSWNARSVRAARLALDAGVRRAVLLSARGVDRAPDNGMFRSELNEIRTSS